MKQSFPFIGTVVICSLLIVVLAWAPFTYPLATSQIIKYALIGAALGIVFYFIGIRKVTARKKAAHKPPTAERPVRKKGKHVKLPS